jgi:hypothetical protein
MGVVIQMMSPGAKKKAPCSASVLSTVEEFDGFEIAGDDKGLPVGL